VACLARCNGAEVVHHHATDRPKNLLLFREDVERVCRGQDERLVVSYSRKTFEQSGDGHFSPIGGYDKEEDLVLILDVARFKYPPHWVPLTLLWQSMQTVDSESGKTRGWLVLRAAAEEQKLPPLCYTVAGGFGLSWAGMDHFLSQPIPLPSDTQKGVPPMVRAFFLSLPPGACKILTLGEKSVETDHTQEIRALVQRHRVYELVSRELTQFQVKCCDNKNDPCVWHPEVATILLLATSTRHLWDVWPEEDAQALFDFCNVEHLAKPLRLELAKVQFQLQRMQAACC